MTVSAAGQWLVSLHSLHPVLEATAYKASCLLLDCTLSADVKLYPICCHPGKWQAPRHYEL